MRLELMVEINGQSVLLDTDSNGNVLSIPITYQISDINDISTNNSTYTQQVTLPDTKHNRESLKYVFGINSNSSWDITKKSKCWVINDTSTVLIGTLQLTEIDYDRQTGMDVYQCIIYGDNNTLFNTIGEEFLYQLNLERFNHIWNATSITNSWVGDYTNGYYYPLIDYTGGSLTIDIISGITTSIPIGLTVKDFYPGLYVKPVFDQIFMDATFSYVSDTLSDTLFQNLYMPFCNAAMVPNINTTLIYDSSYKIWEGDGMSPIIPGQTQGSFLNMTFWNSFNLANDSYDPNSLYDISSFEFTMPVLAPFAQYFDLFVDITLGLTGSFPFTGSPWTSLGDDLQIIIKRSMYPDGTPVAGWSNTPSYAQITGAGVGAGWPYIPISGYGGNYNQISLRSDNNSLAPAPVYLGGDKWNIQYSFQTDQLIADASAPYPYNIPQPLRAGESVRFFFVRYGTSGVYTDISTVLNSDVAVSSHFDPSVVFPGVGLSASSLLPQNIKKKDFLTSLFNILNLWIEPDKNIPGLYRIETQDYYFQKYGVVKDWTKKLDLSQVITSVITSNTQNKVNIFSYTADKDYYNSVYTTSTNQIYGQYEFDIDNDFISDEKDIKPLFSPTIIDKVLNSYNMFLPTIVNYNNGNSTPYSGMNPRLLYKSPQPLIFDVLMFDGVTYSTYPCAMPFDDPLNPTLSLNYGQVPAFYPSFNDTTGNLFYNYWQNTMIQISDKDNRIVTAFFYLTATDISQFYFSDIIFFRLDGSEGYYTINQIINYDPSTDMPTQVELIKAQNYII